MTTAEPVRVVAVCQGHRCRALLAAQEPHGMTALREAVRHSHRGALVSTGCAGPCAQGPVVVLGEGLVDAGRLRTTPQAVLGPVRADQVRVLSGHLRSEGGLLPAELVDVSLPVRV